MDEDPRRHLFPAKRPYFFKILIPTYYKMLPIPVKFARRFCEELSEVALLKDPTGSTWSVELKKTDSEVLFRNGWLEFIKDHSLCVGCVLVFRYDGNSQFSVLMFDQSACDLEYPYAFEKCEKFKFDIGSRNPERGKDVSTENICASAPLEVHDISSGKVEGEDLLPGEKGYSSQVLHHAVHPSSHSDESVQEVTSLNGKIQSTSEMSKNRSKEFELIDTKERNTSADVHQNLRCCSTLCCTLHQNVHKSNSSGLPERNYLSPGRGTKCIKSVPPIGNRFAESIYASLSTFRVGKNHHTQQVDIHQEKHSGESEAKISFSKTLEYRQKCGESGYMPANGMNPYRRWFTSRRGPVTTADKDRACQAAERYSAELIKPFFKIVLQRSHVYFGFKVHIPMQFSKSCMSREMQHVTLHISNKRKQRIGIFFRGHGAILSKKWQAFVLDNNLEEGDVCIFELLKWKNMEFKVSVFRVVEEITPLMVSSKSKERKSRMNLRG